MLSAPFVKVGVFILFLSPAESDHVQDLVKDGQVIPVFSDKHDTCSYTGKQDDNAQGNAFCEAVQNGTKNTADGCGSNCFIKLTLSVTLEKLLSGLDVRGDV